jgi:hypothetical protein
MKDAVGAIRRSAPSATIKRDEILSAIALRGKWNLHCHTAYLSGGIF